METKKRDWSKYEVKGENPTKKDWSQYEVKEESQTPSNPEITGLTGIASDVMDLFGKAVEGITNLPENMRKVSKYTQENPDEGMSHYLGQVEAGAGDILKTTLNSPFDIPEYLMKKHLHPGQILAEETPSEIKGKSIRSEKDITKNFKDYFQSTYPKALANELLKTFSHILPRIPEDTGIEKALGLQPKPETGDNIFRALPAVVAGGAGVYSGLKSAKRALTAPSRERKYQRAQEKLIDEAAEKTGMSKVELEALKDSLNLEYSKYHEGAVGELSPVGQQVVINQKELKLAKHAENAAIPHEEVGEIPEAPNRKAIVEEEVSKKVAEAETIRKDLESDLGTKENPRIKAGSKIKSAIEKLKKSSSDLYNAARQHYVDKKIKANNSAEIKAATKDLEELKNKDELAPGYGSGTAEQKTLEETIAGLKGEEVDARHIYDLQRTLSSMAKGYREAKYKTAGNQLEFNRLENLENMADSHAAKLAKRLESVGGEDVQSMVQEANKGWKTYHEVKKHSVGGIALKGKAIPSDSLLKLATEEKGNDFFTKLTESMPELKKQLVAAHVGPTNIEGPITSSTTTSMGNKLTKPDSVVKKYLENEPLVEAKVNAFRNALEDIRTGKRTAEGKAANVEKEYKELKTSMEDAAKRQKLRNEAIEKSDALKKQIKFHEEAIPKLEEKIKAVDENSAEHAKLEKDLKEHKQNLVDKNHLLKKYSHAVLTMTGVNAALHRIGL